MAKKPKPHGVGAAIVAALVKQGLLPSVVDVPITPRLYIAGVTFVHPVTGEEVTVEPEGFTHQIPPPGSS